MKSNGKVKKKRKNEVTRRLTDFCHDTTTHSTSLPLTYFAEQKENPLEFCRASQSCPLPDSDCGKENAKRSFLYLLSSLVQRGIEQREKKQQEGAVWHRCALGDS
jgi:hypothetical protein